MDINKSDCYQGEGYRVDFKVTSQRQDAFNGEIVITNQGEEAIKGWSLAFDFDENIERFLTAKIVSHEANHYVIKNSGYNANIQGGQALVLGFSGSLGNVQESPTNYVLNQIGQEIDEDKDTDEDGLPDEYEYYYLDTNPTLEDTDGNGILDADEDFDGDGLTNLEEYEWMTEPFIEDTDGDELKDGDEVKLYATNPVIFDEIDFEQGTGKDTDQDGLADEIEMRLGTDINYMDTDKDGLPDGYEVHILKTNPTKKDTDENGVLDSKEDFDEDGLNNAAEYVLGTNSYCEDTDNDGLGDKEEVELGTDPLVEDTDQDGLPDGYEVYILQTNPAKRDTDENGVLDSKEDFDEDGLNNAGEYVLGTNSYCEDTDNDGLGGKEEVELGTDPLLEDTDGDGILDGDEIKLNLDPLSAYTHGNVADNKYQFEQEVLPQDIAINERETDYQFSLDVTAAGYAPSSLVVTNSSYEKAITSNPAVLGTPLEINYDEGKEVSAATLKFEINEENIDNSVTLNDESDPELQGIKRFNIFKYFEEEGMLLPIETFHDIANNEVYAEVDELGVYCIMLNDTLK